MLEVKLDFSIPEGWAIDRIGAPQKGEFVVYIKDGVSSAMQIDHGCARLATVVLTKLFDEQVFISKLSQILRPGWVTYFDDVWYYFPKFDSNKERPKWVEAIREPKRRYVRSHWVGTKFPLQHNHLNVDFPLKSQVPTNYLFTIGDHSEPS